jgi:hypothetical protein
MPKMNFDHVVMNTATNKYECKHCGATQSPPKMPVPISDLLDHMDMFTAAHKSCKAPEPRPSEYEQGFEAGYSFVVAAIESQLDLPPYDEHTAILERLLDYLRH